MIFSEPLAISPQTHYPFRGALFNEKHTDAWKKIVEMVHKEKSKIIATLIHDGRAYNLKSIPNNAIPPIWAHSNIPIKHYIYN